MPAMKPQPIDIFRFARVDLKVDPSGNMAAIRGQRYAPVNANIHIHNIEMFASI